MKFEGGTCLSPLQLVYRALLVYIGRELVQLILVAIQSELVSDVKCLINVQLAVISVLFNQICLEHVAIYSRSLKIVYIYTPIEF